jgi:hypothetical protein
MKRFSKVFCILVLGAYATFAQTDSTKTSVIEKPPVKEDKLLKFNLNDDGSHYFRVTFLNQAWVRFNESNPGTVQNGEAQGQTFDIGLRRTRIQLFGQITDRSFVYFQFGTNNVNSQALSPGNTNRKVQAFFHDAVGEYKVFKNKDWMKVGGGLTIVNGLSRFSGPSIATILSLDVPVFLQSTVDVTDQFSRKLSVYARGQVGKWDYRVAISDPYPFANSGNPVALNYNQATFAGVGHHHQYQAYLMHMFFDKEDHVTPGYNTGSYLGKKKVLSIGAGLIYQPRATWYQKGANNLTGTATANAKNKNGIPVPDSNTVYNDLLEWGLEVFYDAPINKEKGTALSLMGGFYYTDYGRNYIRMNGLMNPVPVATPANVLDNGTNGNGSYNGSGNAYPMFGTGTNVYMQAAYLFKRDLLGELGTLQPYATARFANYQYLQDPMQIFDLGVNWLINGHKSKISLDWEYRPIYDSNLTIIQRNSSVILQYQIFI